MADPNYPGLAESGAEAFASGGLDLGADLSLASSSGLFGGGGRSRGIVSFRPAPFIPGGGGGGSLAAYNVATDVQGDQLINPTTRDRVALTPVFAGPRVYDLNRVRKAMTQQNIWAISMGVIDEYPGGAGSRSYPPATERALLEEGQTRKQALQDSGSEDGDPRALWGVSWDLSLIIDLEEWNNRAAVFYEGWQSSLRPSNLNHDEIDGPPFRGQQVLDRTAELRATLDQDIPAPPPMPIAAAPVLAPPRTNEISLIPDYQGAYRLPGHDGDAEVPGLAGLDAPGVPSAAGSPDSKLPMAAVWIIGVIALLAIARNA